MPVFAAGINFIRQFATILSVNKTMDYGKECSLLYGAYFVRAFFHGQADLMRPDMHYIWRGEEDMIRYSVITEKNPREIVLLRGRGCAWRKCRFCDYHLDFGREEAENFRLNSDVLSHVTGVHHRLEVINSGSFVDLDESTMERIEEVCRAKAITELHFECHWMHRERIPALRERFARKGVHIHMKIGVETFDTLFRECYLVKGIDTDEPAGIAEYFDEVCLLQGIPGQSVTSMKKDIETGLRHFSRVCVNIMAENFMPVKPDPRVIEEFRRYILPEYEQNERVDILMENTDFGVGGECEENI